MLDKQPIATFVLLTAFAGPILSFTNYATNPGFEIAGAHGTGKSTALKLAAAVCGPADNPNGSNYWLTANATINALEGVMSSHHDMTLMIDEMNLYASTDHFAKRAAMINGLVFALAEGSEKARYDRVWPKRHRFVFITSTNEALAVVLAGGRVAVAEAAADRLNTIPIGDDRPFGIFDSLPMGYEKIGDFAEELNRQTRHCYGVAMRHFLTRLVAERAKDCAALEGRIGELMNFFRQQAGVDRNDGSETRAADAHGLAYTAGVIAVEYGAISRKLDPLDAALTCYRLNRAARAKPLDPLKQLLKLAGDFDVLEVRFDRLPELSDAEIDEAPAILRWMRNGKRELLLTEDQLNRAIPNRSVFFADPGIRRIMVCESDRRGTKRQIRSNRRPERFYCFRLPDGAA